MFHIAIPLDMVECFNIYLQTFSCHQTNQHEVPVFPQNTKRSERTSLIFSSKMSTKIFLFKKIQIWILNYWFAEIHYLSRMQKATLKFKDILRLSRNHNSSAKNSSSKILLLTIPNIVNFVQHFILSREFLSISLRRCNSFLYSTLDKDLQRRNRYLFARLTWSAW